MSATAKKIIIGDISDAWPVSIKDTAGELIPLDGFTCLMVLIDRKSGAEVLSREITQIVDGAFLAYLSEEETRQLEPDTHYLLVWQLSNLNLEKPIKKEAEPRSIMAIAGHIN